MQFANNCLKQQPCRSNKLIYLYSGHDYTTDNNDSVGCQRYILYTSVRNQVRIDKLVIRNKSQEGSGPLTESIWLKTHESPTQIGIVAYTIGRVHKFNTQYDTLNAHGLGHSLDSAKPV